MHYRWMNRGDRIEAPLVKKDGGCTRLTGTKPSHASWRFCAGRRQGGGIGLAGRLERSAWRRPKRLLSGFNWTGAFQVVMGEEAPLAGIPDLALRAERAPNAKGAEQLGYTRDYAQALATAKVGRRSPRAR